MNAWLNIVAAAVVAALVSPPAPADSSLSAARELYASADYEESLAILDGLQATAPGGEEARNIEQYRAYCLLALGRSVDAEQAIAAVVMAAPLYRPSDDDVSPRVQSAFRDVRMRMMPSIVQNRYAAAKASFDAKQFSDAAARFAEVLDAMADPDMAALMSEAPLSDLRTLAAGFKELSTQMAATPAVPAAPPPAPAPASYAAAAAVAAPPRIYGSDDPVVAAPIPLRQSLPAFPAQLRVTGPGVLEVIVSESGTVESAAMRSPVSPKYDPMVIDAALKWKYHPATREGIPVKYRKLLQIAVQR